MSSIMGSKSWLNVLVILLAAAFAVYTVGQFAPLLVSSLIGELGKGYWDLSRASGVVAYLLFWASIMLGLLMSNKLARAWPGGPTAFALHEFMCLLGLVFAVFHAGILLADPYINFSIGQILLPFTTSADEPFWVGLGQIGFYLLLAIACSFYVRSWIGTAVWRWLHFATFIAYMLITVHGMIVGSDSKTPLMLGVYALTNTAVWFLTIYRILAMRTAKF